MWSGFVFMFRILWNEHLNWHISATLFTDDRPFRFANGKYNKFYVINVILLVSLDTKQGTVGLHILYSRGGSRLRVCKPQASLKQVQSNTCENQAI